MAKKSSSLIPAERIERAILFLRGQKVMLDADLASLYGVATKHLVQAVKRNRERFPDDFAFLRTRQEFTNLRSQAVTSSSTWGGRRSPPWAFTEQGVAMLSSVLRSPRCGTLVAMGCRIPNSHPLPVRRLLPLFHQACPVRFNPVVENPYSRHLLA